jgi:hypothetical protein
LFGKRGTLLKEVPMTEFAPRKELAQVATITEELLDYETAAPTTRNEIDRGFGLPTGLYGLTVAAYLGFIGMMASAFANPSLVLPMVVFAVVIVAAFGVPTLWVRMRPDNSAKAMTFQQLKNRGIETGSGHLDGSAAAVQVLILPALILCWGIVVAVIAALT